MHNSDDVNLENAPRCRDCAYCLVGLAERRCPECGREFDLTDPSSYTTRPALMRWRLWLPGLLLATGGGLIVFLVLFVASLGVGWAATLATPVSIGIILGYRCRVRPLAYLLLVLTALSGILAAIYAFQLSGLFCSVIAFCVLFGPMLVGAFLGMVLRTCLKASDFDQRSYLPLLIMLVLPIFLAIAEKSLGFEEVVTNVQTSRVLQLPKDRAWQSIRYFDQISGTQPLLFRLGALQPVRTYGSLNTVGDIQVCKYRSGTVTKKLRTYDYGETIVFDVIEQDFGFKRSVRLLSGSFQVDALDATSTRLTLRTDYEALLRPRAIWGPFERYTLRTLHKYILDGIERQGLANSLLSPTKSRLAYDGN